MFMAIISVTFESISIRPSNGVLVITFSATVMTLVDNTKLA